MADISEFIADLDSALSYESVRIKGDNALLSLPTECASEQSKSEIREALAWCTERRDRLKAALTAVKALFDHGYPKRVQQIAYLEAIQELKSTLEVLTLSVDELQEPPVATLTFEFEPDV